MALINRKEKGIMISILGLLIGLNLNIVEATKHWGLCPAVDSNIKNGQYNVSKMMGIWYEFLVTPDFKDGQQYDCASWLMLQDQKNDT